MCLIRKIIRLVEKIMCLVVSSTTHGVFARRGGVPFVRGKRFASCCLCAAPAVLRRAAWLRRSLLCLLQFLGALPKCAGALLVANFPVDVARVLVVGARLFPLRDGGKGLVDVDFGLRVLA